MRDIDRYKVIDFLAALTLMRKTDIILQELKLQKKIKYKIIFIIFRYYVKNCGNDNCH